MITEVAAKAAEVISNAAHAVGEAAKAGIEHVQQTAECDVNELKVNETRFPLHQRNHTPET